jgi:hypothetical protein
MFGGGKSEEVSEPAEASEATDLELPAAADTMAVQADGTAPSGAGDARQDTADLDVSGDEEEDDEPLVLEPAMRPAGPSEGDAAESADDAGEISDGPSGGDEMLAQLEAVFAVKGDGEVDDAGSGVEDAAVDVEPADDDGKETLLMGEAVEEPLELLFEEAGDGLAVAAEADEEPGDEDSGSEASGEAEGESGDEIGEATDDVTVEDDAPESLEEVADDVGLSEELADAAGADASGADTDEQSYSVGADDAADDEPDDTVGDLAAAVEKVIDDPTVDEILAEAGIVDVALSEDAAIFDMSGDEVEIDAPGVDAAEGEEMDSGSDGDDDAGQGQGIEEDDDGLIRAPAVEPAAGLTLSGGALVSDAEPEPVLAEAGETAAGSGDDALEETVRRILREELAGEMGQRLSKNIQRMIREEISRLK